MNAPTQEFKDPYRHLGDFNAAPPEYGVYLTCDNCMVSWIGCWDNARCPQCDDSTAWEKLMEDRKSYKEFEHSTDHSTEPFPKEL